MEKHPRCANCGRKLTENELYCYFCDMAVPESDKNNKEIDKYKRKEKK